MKKERTIKPLLIGFKKKLRRQIFGFVTLKKGAKETKKKKRRERKREREGTNE